MGEYAAFLLGPPIRKGRNTMDVDAESLLGPQ